MIRKLGFWLVLLTALSVTAGAAAVLHIDDTAPLQVIELDVTVPRPTTTTTTEAPEPTPTDPPPPEHGRGAEKIWVCVILQDKDGNPRLKEGKNPIHVSVNAQDALDGRSPHHLSYVVPSGDVECVLPEG